METQEQNSPPDSALAYWVDRVPAVTGATRTQVFAAIRDKELTARKLGHRTIIEADELRRWLRTLPTRGRQPEMSAA